MVIDAENLLNVVQVMSLCLIYLTDVACSFLYMYILCMCVFALPMLVTAIEKFT